MKVDFDFHTLVTYDNLEFEKWRGIHASLGGVGGMLAWVEWVTSLRGWHASMDGVGGVVA